MIKAWSKLVLERKYPQYLQLVATTSKFFDAFSLQFGAKVQIDLDQLRREKE